MTTVATPEYVYVHIPKTGGTTITLAIAAAKSIEYDYRYCLVRPHSLGLTYDDNCRLKCGDSFLREPPGTNPHASIDQLRGEDCDKKVVISIREPHSWYRSFWAHHAAHGWSFTSRTPNELLRDGGNTEFRKWLQNIIDDGYPGLCTRYFEMYGFDYAIRVRLESLADDWRTRVCDGACDFMDRRYNICKSDDPPEIPEDLIASIREIDSKIYGEY